MDPAQALDPDPFDVAMANLHTAGIDFEEVDPPPPDRTREPPPGEDDGSAKKAVGVASPETVAQPTDRNGAETMGEWQQALRDADDLTRTERYVGLMQSTWFDYKAADSKPWIETHVSQVTLAEKCGLNRETVRKALKGLVRKGYLHAQPRPGDSTIYGAMIPGGAEVVPIRPPNGGDHHPPTAETTTPQRRRPRPKQDRKQDRKRAAPSLTDDPELYSAMLRLAQVSGARSPKAWIPGVFADDIAPIIAERGRDAGLAEIDRRIASKKPRRSTHYPPDQEGHGDSVATATNW